MTYIPDETERYQEVTEKCERCQGRGKIIVYPAEFIEEKLAQDIKELKKRLEILPTAHISELVKKYIAEWEDYLENDEIICPDCGGDKEFTSLV